MQWLTVMNDERNTQWSSNVASGSLATVALPYLNLVRPRNGRCASPISLPIACLALRPIFTFNKISLKIVGWQLPLRGSGPDNVWQPIARRCLACRASPVKKHDREKHLESSAWRKAFASSRARVGYHRDIATIEELSMGSPNQVQCLRTLRARTTTRALVRARAWGRREGSY